MLTASAVGPRVRQRKLPPRSTPRQVSGEASVWISVIIIIIGSGVLMNLLVAALLMELHYSMEVRTYYSRASHASRAYSSRVDSRPICTAGLGTLAPTKPPPRNPGPLTVTLPSDPPARQDLETDEDTPTPFSVKKALLLLLKKKGLHERFRGVYGTDYKNWLRASVTDEKSRFNLFFNFLSTCWLGGGGGGGGGTRGAWDGQEPCALCLLRALFLPCHYHSCFEHFCHVLLLVRVSVQLDPRLRELGVHGVVQL